MNRRLIIRMLGALLLIDRDHLALSLSRNHPAALLRLLHSAALVTAAADAALIAVILILQAAHKAAADTGNLRGIEREILVLGHADGHGLKVA